MTSAPPDLQAFLTPLVGGATLTEAEAEAAFEVILAGKAGDAQIGAMLALLAVRPGGATVDEMVGATRAIRRRATPVPIPSSGPFTGARLLDTCGTGGAPKLFNVSTIGAIIIAAASGVCGGRLAVCKHGNVSRTGRGSAELMQRLGVRIDAEPKVQSRCLGEAGICFCFAPAHHNAVRHASAARKSVGFPTIFNLLGPLANPGGAQRQVMGTWTHHNAELLAHSLHRLGCERALVFSSRDGLDELTPTDVNIAHEVSPPGVRTFEFDAASVGIPRRTIAELKAGSLDDAVQLAVGVLRGQPGAPRETALLNAAAGLWIGGVAADIRDGLDAAAEAIDSGRAAATLELLARLTNEPEA